MQNKISQQTKQELLKALRERYGQASRIEKSKILDEFVAIAKCHRKHAIRLLTSDDLIESNPSAAGRRIYSEAVREALIFLWEAADRICGKRLKMILPSLLTAMERHKRLSLDPTVRELVLSASPATIDRSLNHVRGTASGRAKRKRVRRSASRRRSGRSRIGRIRNLGSSRSTSFRMAAVRCKACFCRV